MRCDIKARWYGLLASIGAAVVLCSCASDKAGVDGHAAQEVADPLPRNVLIITGEDYPGHKWRQTTPVLASAIRADARLNVEVLDDLGRLGEEDLGRYAAIVLHFKNYDPAIPGRRGFERLVQFVNDDGGLVLVHFACGAFEEFDHDYEQLVGRIWFGANPPPGEHQHDPYGQFRVEFTDLDHEISRGLASFDTTDEQIGRAH
ncbi:MAG: ThuA domain-containing protein, partial [Phycisphaerales bacterium JB038]